MTCLTADAGLHSSEMDSMGPPEKRLEKKTRYIVIPKDAANKDSLMDVENFLKNATQTDQIYSFTDQSRGQFMWWVVNAILRTS